MKKDCIAMLLAGGEGKRLGGLTKHLAKPAVPFGGKYRIIDFALSNCTNSGIDTVGILTQYQAQQLHEYIAEGDIWGFNPQQGGAIKLPSLIEKNAGNCYQGTADAVYQNLCFIEHYDPEHVLIISGDHIYKMNYMLMLAYHKKKNADVTIGVVKVPWEEASRFGTITADNKGRIICFEEKPQHPKSNLASMGIYIFNTKVLKEFLSRDKQNSASSHDFGKDVIPLILQRQKEMYAYFFSGYWKDVGTPVSLWKANMDLLEKNPLLDTNDDKWKIYSAANDLQLKYVAPSAKIQKSIISRGCCILGEVKNSVVFSEVWVGENSLIQDSIIMSNVKIGANVVITRSIIGSNAVINDGCHIGDAEESAEITVIDEKAVLYGKVAVKKQLLQSG